MPDKDDFTFDDDDDFPETDLSGVFEDAEQKTPEEPDLAGPSDVAEEDEIVYGEEIEELPPAENEPGGGGSKSRVLLLVLLLIVSVAGGIYYFMGGDSPSASQQAQTGSQQVVAVPAPQPAEPEPPAAASPAGEAPGSTGTDAGGTVVETAADGTGGLSETASSQPDAGGAPLSANAAADRVETEAMPPLPAIAMAGDDDTRDAIRETGSQSPGEVLTVSAKTAGTPTPQTAPAGKDGAYTLDAGAFLFASQRDDLKTKIRALGYEPEETQVKASVRLIRLRVGSYSKEQLPEALERAGRIAPGAFSQIQDGQYVVYAGSFANQDNVQRLKARYLAEGITLAEEPVKVDKVLNQVRFGSFADDASAEKAAGKAEDAGIPARVIAVN